MMLILIFGLTIQIFVTKDKQERIEKVLQVLFNTINILEKE